MKCRTRRLSLTKNLAVNRHIKVSLMPTTFYLPRLSCFFAVMASKHYLMNILQYIVVMTLLLPITVEAGECVVLLHGLVRTERSLSKIESALNDAGYHAVNIGYPSTKYTIEKLAETAITEALSHCPVDKTVHFVTHSLGGVLIRKYLSKKSISNLGRVVMLGPPNKGSHVVDKIKTVPGFKLINGPAGMQLGTGEFSVPNQLGPANFDVGIIAGTRSINLILSSILPNPDDGKVSVENTKLEGMSDHISLPVTHPFMMRNQDVINQAIYFLEHGVFKRKSQK